MALLEFQKPEKVIMIESDETQGTFEFRPLEPGYGITVGNALRRVLLSSLEGFAITKVKIEGVEHEFSTITGVIEDVNEIILNLKQVRFKQVADDTVNGEKLNVTLSGKNEFKAGDLNNFLNNFEVINNDLLICTMEPDVKLQMEIHIDKGRGYVQSEENISEDDPVGMIAIDSIFTPIKNVKYTVENYRVEQKTDFEKLLFDIQTDGSIHPKDALKEAAKILIYHLMLFSDEKITLDTEEKYGSDEFDEEALHMRQLLKTKLVDLDLSVRALNCLKAAEVETLGDLVQYNKNDLLKFRNFGKKSLAELDELLDKMNLSFGMDVSKYKLDKE
ncbi:MAG: DNA-directed RNA polymerase subunit alpha [Bacteroidales bacterium]